MRMSQKLRCMTRRGARTVAATVDAPWRDTSSIRAKSFSAVLLGGALVGIALQVSGAMAAAAEGSPLPNADYGVSTLWPLAEAGIGVIWRWTPAAHLLFVSRSDRVDVVGTSSGRRIAAIPNTDGVRGIAIAAEFKRGYISNGRSNTVTAFDLDTFRVIQESPVAGKKPDGVLYEPQSQHVLTANGASNDISILDRGRWR